MIATRTTTLGGRDFTEKIKDALTSIFEKEYKPIDSMTGNMQVRTRYEILQKAKEVKHDIATGELDETTVELKKLDCDEDDDEELPVDFRREEMLEVISSLLEDAKKFVTDFFALVSDIYLFNMHSSFSLYVLTNE